VPSSSLILPLFSQSQECQAERLKLVNFIRTKAKPHIFYLPILMNDILEGKKKETAQVINGL
jgi:predicted MPP superfamily phosphohydrolase